MVEADVGPLAELSFKATLSAKTLQLARPRARNDEPPAGDGRAAQRPLVLEDERPAPFADPSGDALEPDEAGRVLGEADLKKIDDSVGGVEPTDAGTSAAAAITGSMQPFRIEDEARKLAGTNFIVSGRFKPHAVRDGNLVTGQQQYSGALVARLVIEALGT